MQNRCDVDRKNLHLSSTDKKKYYKQNFYMEDEESSMIQIESKRKKKQRETEEKVRRSTEGKRKLYSLRAQRATKTTFVLNGFYYSFSRQ